MESVDFAQPLMIFVLIFTVVFIGKVIGSRKPRQIIEEHTDEQIDDQQSQNQTDTLNPNLVPCRDCGATISKAAPTCLSCGAVTKAGKKDKRKERTRKRGNIQGAGCLLVILAFMLAVIGTIVGLGILGLPLAFVLGIIGFVVLLAGLFV
nr:hypothetical protein [uncultured Desulfobacter sp.]